MDWSKGSAVWNIKVPVKKIGEDEADLLAQQHGGYILKGCVVLPALVAHDYKEQELIDEIMAELVKEHADLELVSTLIDKLGKKWGLDL